MGRRRRKRERGGLAGVFITQDAEKADENSVGFTHRQLVQVFVVLLSAVPLPVIRPVMDPRGNHPDRNRLFHERETPSRGSATRALQSNHARRGDCCQGSGHDGPEANGIEK